MTFTSKQKNSLIFVGVTIAAICLLIWALRPQPAPRNMPATRTNSPVNMAQASPLSTTSTQQSVSGSPDSLPVLAPSLRGTEIDCPLQVDKNSNLLLTIGIRSCFDYFLSSLGEKTEQQLLADIRQYLNSVLPVPAATYAHQLLNQYIAYKQALGSIQPAQQATELKAESLQRVVNDMQNLQRQFFSPAEITAFFGDETAYNQFSIQQLKISADNSLTTQQKAAKTAELINQLPSALADSIRPALQFAQLQQLTSDIQARGGSAAELRAMRENLVGAAAADRLEQVDQDEANWKHRVDDYLVARDQLKNSSLDATDKQQAMTILRNRTFTLKEDNLRAQTFEQIHDSVGRQKK